MCNSTWNVLCTSPTEAEALTNTLSGPMPLTVNPSALKEVRDFGSLRKAGGVPCAFDNTGPGFHKAVDSLGVKDLIHSEKSQHQ